MMQLRKATRQKAKLRIGLAGPSGSGKTLSSLLLAYGMIGNWNKIAVIDTENGSAELEVGRRINDLTIGDYNVITLEAPFTPERYIEAIKACEQAGIEVIIIDSVSHEWSGKGGTLEIHGSMAGNSFTNWAKVTPRHNAFIDAIVQSPVHIITTIRKKQEYEMSRDSQGKAEVTKLGLQEIQRDGFSYEVTLNFDVSIDHYAKADKDRTGLFMDKPSFKITPEIGAVLMKWANEGEELVKFEPSRDIMKPDAKRDLMEALTAFPMVSNEDEAVEFLNKRIGTKFTSIQSLTDDQAIKALEKFNNL